MIRNSYVFVSCGKRHVDRLHVALKFLRHFTQIEIIVVSRDAIKADCDRLITSKVPARLDDHQASIYLKTSLHKILANPQGRYCYLDNDIMAVNSGVDEIFKQALEPISFVADHCNLRQFSRYAVKCRCAGQECEHLHEAIQKKFKVAITDAAWRQWNGGVFIFDHRAAGFMEQWHKYTLAALADPYWMTRDQGTLAATVWKMGLQHQRTLDRQYNWIVDPFRFDRNFRSQRKTRQPGEIPMDESYALNGGQTDKPRPSLLHFINGGVGRHGWKNWDDVERLLTPPVSVKRSVVEVKPAPQPANVSASIIRPLSPDNHIVHGLWIGKSLSRMELLTIHSFLQHGHEFHLWLYDDLETPLPKEVVIENANEIIPQNRIIKKAENDPESGVGKGSFSSPFSDLFRYKLLYEKGGYWVDMDVTCLRPFDFDTPYLFRAHRVGVVGNIMKCPPRSRLMEKLFDAVAAQVNEHTEWLKPNRMLSEMVKRMKLTRYIRTDLWNQELWWDVVRPLALEDQPVPENWYAIHWINEFWRTLKESGGMYRGRRLYSVPPDKDHPMPGSALAKLYAQYLPVMSAAATAVPAPVVARPEPPLNPSVRRQPPALAPMASHINIAIASLARGGAERIVLETLDSLLRNKVSAKIFVPHQARASYDLPSAAGLQVFRLHALQPGARMQAIASETLASPNPVLYTHLIRLEHLQMLWARGVKTIPVIHNTREGWQDPPTAYNVPQVPFVVAVSEQVAGELRESGCLRLVIVIRHELQRWFSIEEQQKHRAEIRRRYAIPDGTILIGMVGEFKSQKAYPRAVRVLAQVRQQAPAKLMILGGWDHDWGHGRQTYTATMRLALEMGVITDILTPGPMPDVEKYYPAFDVLLNTSVFEGLNVSLLEAIHAGCPLVMADVGGNREVMPPRAVLVKDPSDIPAYVQGIAQALQVKPRIVAVRPPDSDLVPRIWHWLGRYGFGDPVESAGHRSGVLFLTDDLDFAGPGRSLVDLLGQLPRSVKTWLCVLQPVCCQAYLEEVERNGVAVFSTHDAPDYLERVERILRLIESFKVRHICFWNVDPRVRLLLAKILPAESVRLTEAGQGPGLVRELEQSARFQHRIVFTGADYWRRLDHFVAGYSSGIPKDFPAIPGQVVVIPNGVTLPPVAGPVAPLWSLKTDPDLVIGTVCPVAPGCRIDLLIEMMAALNQRLQGVNLMIVGGIDPGKVDYWRQLMQRLEAAKVRNIHFVGPQADASPFLRRFKVFVTFADAPGAAIASLEAMAMGIPVVAANTGGLGEPVLHGINGFLVNGADAREMSRHVRDLLVNPGTRRRLGEAARATAERDFSLILMSQRYTRLFEPPLPVSSAITKSVKIKSGARKRPKPNRTRHD